MESAKLLGVGTKWELGTEQLPPSTAPRLLRSHPLDTEFQARSPVLLLSGYETGHGSRPSDKELMRDSFDNNLLPNWQRRSPKGHARTSSDIPASAAGGSLCSLPATSLLCRDESPPW